MPLHASATDHRSLVEDTRPQTLRCIVCQRPLRTYRPSEGKEVMIQCRHCRTLQHRRLGRLPA
jgi:hypothetical protein